MIFSADWKSRAVVPFILTSPRVTFSADAGNAVTFSVGFTDLEGESVTPVGFWVDFSGTDIIVWNTLFQNFAAVVFVHAVFSGEAIIAFTWLVTFLWFTLAFSSVAKTFRFLRVWSVGTGDEFLGWSALWSINWFTLTTFLDFADVVFSATSNTAAATPDSSGTTVGSGEVSVNETFWERAVVRVSFLEASWRSVFVNVTGGPWVAPGDSLDLAINEFLFTLASLAFFGWVLPVVLVDFVDFRAFDTFVSDFDDSAFASPDLAAAGLDEFSFADFAWVVAWGSAGWSIADFATLWNWWASAFEFVATWVLWVWSFNLFDFTFSRVTSDFFHEFRASTGFASVAALLWFTSETVVTPAFGFTENLSGGVASWWTWSDNHHRLDFADSVSFDTVEDSAIVFPSIGTWSINITEMGTFAIVDVLASVSWATETGLSGNNMDNSISSSAKVDGEWFSWTSWWADASFLDAHAGIGDDSVGFLASVSLSLLVEGASVVFVGGDLIVFANEFGVGGESESFAIVSAFSVSATVSFATTSISDNTGVLAWFTWGWGNTGGGDSGADFGVVETVTKVTLGGWVFVPGRATFVLDTVDGTFGDGWWGGWAWSAWSGWSCTWSTWSGWSSTWSTWSGDCSAFVGSATVVKHTGDEWTERS